MTYHLLSLMQQRSIHNYLEKLLKSTPFSTCTLCKARFSSGTSTKQYYNNVNADTNMSMSLSSTKSYKKGIFKDENNATLLTSWESLRKYFLIEVIVI
jgi:hypothetical protein